MALSAVNMHSIFNRPNIESLVLAGGPTRAKPFQQRRVWIALGVDALLIVTLVVLSTLIAIGMLKTGLPIGPGLVKNALFWGLTGGATVIILLDMITSAVRAGAKNKSKIRNKLIEKKDVQFTAPDVKKINESRTFNYHHIAEGLYLGDRLAFMGCTHLKVSTNDKKCRPVDVETSNREMFTTIITATPLKNLADASNFHEYTQADIKASLDKHSINWLFVGGQVRDEAVFWPVLVNSCSAYSAGEQKEFPKGLLNPEAENILKENSEALDQLPIEEWFKSAFTAIDGAIYGEEKVLVHCGEGVSRSATILAAYFINRFGYTAKQACAFLCTKRACVESQFMSSLEKYEKALHSHRSSQGKTSAL